MTQVTAVYEARRQPCAFQFCVGIYFAIFAHRQRLAKANPTTINPQKRNAGRKINAHILGGCHVPNPTFGHLFMNCLRVVSRFHSSKRRVGHPIDTNIPQ